MKGKVVLSKNITARDFERYRLFKKMMPNKEELLNVSVNQTLPSIVTSELVSEVPVVVTTGVLTSSDIERWRCVMDNIQWNGEEDLQNISI